MGFLKNYSNETKKIDNNISFKSYVLCKLYAFIIAIFFILPIIILDINLINIYYDLELFLIVLLHICFIAIMMIQEKFYLEILKNKNILPDDINQKAIYLGVLFYSVLLSIATLSFILIIRR